MGSYEKAVVLDIEGTVCPISFVHDVLFPYALKRAHELIPALSFPLVASRSQLEEHLCTFPAEYLKSSTTLLDHIDDLTKRDVKAKYLKSLQGYLWKDGYKSGQIKVQLFDDVKPALDTWYTNTKIIIYSSGSVPAQKLLFAHTTQGDLTGLLTNYFDTVNAGPKVEKASYDKIAAAIGLAPKQITFYSDNVLEIQAADLAGWSTVWITRPGNPAPAPGAYKPHITASTLETN